VTAIIDLGGHACIRERLEITLTGHAHDDHTAGVGELGAFLYRIQKLFSAIAQAITTGPRRRGPLSQHIVDATAMRFVDVFPSSFGTEIYIRPQFDVFGESTASSTLQTLFTLLAAAKQEKEVSRLSGELGQRAVGHLRHILDGSTPPARSSYGPLIARSSQACGRT
jgi:hypothetical protein